METTWTSIESAVRQTVYISGFPLVFWSFCKNRHRCTERVHGCVKLEEGRTEHCSGTEQEAATLHEPEPVSFGRTTARLSRGEQEGVATYEGRERNLLVDIQQLLQLLPNAQLHRQGPAATATTFNCFQCLHVKQPTRMTASQNYNAGQWSCALAIVKPSSSCQLPSGYEALQICVPALA